MSKNARGNATGGRRPGKGVGEGDSKGNLLQKIKFYEDELGRYGLTFLPLATLAALTLI